MKTRTGFVSNSSSSSFIIGVKNGELTEKKLQKLFKIEKGSVLQPLVDGLIEFIISDACPYTRKGYLEERCYEDLEELADCKEGKKAKEIFEKGYTFYEGHASNEDDNAMSYAMVEMDIDYEDDEIIFFKEAGF